jgi:accessory colonization factor AcfC
MDTPIRSPLFRDSQLIGFVRECNRKGASVTMNIGVYQDGSASPETIEQLAAVRKSIRGF